MFDQSKITRAEWAALKGAGVTKVLANGKSHRLDKDAAAQRIAAYISEHATVTTEAEFKENGVSLTALIQNVLGLPVSMAVETQEYIEAFVVARMAGTSMGDVQKEFSDRWLVKGTFERIFTSKTDGTAIVQKVSLWAVTDVTDLIVKYAVLPSHKRVLAYEKGNQRDSIEQAKRVPALAIDLMAVQLQRSQLVNRAMEVTRQHLTSGKSADELTTFDAAVAARLDQLDTTLSDIKLAIEAA